MITNELTNEVALMTKEQLAEKFTPEQQTELFLKMGQMLEEEQGKIKELEAENKRLAKRIESGKERFLKQYGAEPFILMELTDDDEVKTALFIEGEINFFPRLTNICDALIIADFIGALLQIPDNRIMCGPDVANHKGNINRIPCTELDMKMYIDMVFKWLMEDVTPKPKMIKLPRRSYKLKGDVYKKAWF